MPNKILFFLLYAILLCACADSSTDTGANNQAAKQLHPWLKGVGRTEDLTPVELILRSEHEKTNGHTLIFSIPKAYLTRKSNWLGGEQEGIEIQTGLPDMLPRPAIKNNRKRPEEPGYQEAQDYADNGLYISIYSRSIFQMFVDRDYKEERRLAAGYRKRYRKDYIMQGEKYKLEHYKNINCRKKKHSDSSSSSEHCIEETHDYYITPETYQGNWISFRCYRLEVHSGGGCTANIRYKRKRVTYIFRRNQLARWQEFDKAVRWLLDQFLIEESEINNIIYTRKSGG